MSKEGIEKYSNKIHEVCLAGVLYPKETVIKTISALVNEYADQQTKELQERVEKLEKINDKGYKLCLDKDDVINKLQAKIDELEKVKDYLCHNTKFEDFNPHKTIDITSLVLETNGVVTFKQQEETNEAVDEMFDYFSTLYYSELINNTRNNQYGTFVEWFKNQNTYTITRNI